MKIRNGFVSNSSTSSFVITTTKDNHEKIMEAIHPYERACIKALGFSYGNLMGTEIVSMGTLSTSGGCAWEYIDVEYDGDDIGEGEMNDMKYDCLYTYQSKAKYLFGENGYISTELDG